ncbi:MAG: ABC transporter permease [Microthrixaceae bacterium]
MELAGWLTLGVGIGLVYGILALGIVLVFKGAKIINFAHPFMGLFTAFTAWWFTSRAAFLPFAQDTRPRFVVAAVLALFLTALNGFALERSIFHRIAGSSRLTQLVATIAVGSGTVGLVTLLFNRNADAANVTRTLPTLLCPASPAPGQQCGWGFRIDYIPVTPPYIQIFLVVPPIALALYLFFQRTKFGVAVRGAAENPDAARLLGISADRVSQFTWVLGSLLAGVAALLIVPISSLDVGSLSNGFLVRALAAALVGGLVSLPGAIVGGLIVGITETMVVWKSDTSGLAELVMFGVVVLVLFTRPGGIFGKPEETADQAAFVPSLRDLPARLRLHPVTPWIGRYWYVTAAGFAIGISRVVGGATNQILINVMAYAIVGVALTVLMGYSGQISLGHWGLAGVGAFTAGNALTRWDLPFVVVVPLVILVGMVVSLLVGLPALRIRGLYLAVVTLAFHLASEVYFFNHSLISGSTAGINVDGPKIGPIDMDAIDGQGLFLFAIVALVFSMWVARNIAGTRTGRGFFALRENERAAAVLGIHLTTYRLLAFAVSGGIAALGGLVFAINEGTIDAVRFPTATSLLLVSMVVIGGLGSVDGAVLGAFVVFGLPRLVHFNNGWIVPIGTGILLIMVITRAPGGLAGLLGFARKGMVTEIVSLADAEAAFEATAPPRRTPSAPTPT